MLRAKEGGHVEIPNGQLFEQGNRVATRTWAAGSNIAVGNLSGVTSEGSGGGLNADQVDGKEATAFADAGHLHDSRYVQESGDTLSGSLDLGGNDIQNANSVSTDESVTITDDDTIAYGRDHGATVQGNNVVVGVGARALEDVNQTIPGNDPRKVVVGFGAAKNDEQFGVTAAGYRAARDNTGSNLTAAGYQAALNNTGNNLTAAGNQAARGDGLADPTTMGDNNIGLGQNAIRNNQASGLIAIGQDAGINAQTDDQLIITQRDGTRRMVMDLTTGDLSITGSLTENASL